MFLGVEFKLFGLDVLKEFIYRYYLIISKLTADLLQTCQVLSSGNQSYSSSYFLSLFYRGQWHLNTKI